MRGSPSQLHMESDRQTLCVNMLSIDVQLHQFSWHNSIYPVDQKKLAYIDHKKLAVYNLLYRERLYWLFSVLS